jgi:hypothetical protein
MMTPSALKLYKHVLCTCADCMHVGVRSKYVQFICPLLRVCYVNIDGCEARHTSAQMASLSSQEHILQLLLRVQDVHASLVERLHAERALCSALTMGREGTPSDHRRSSQTLTQPNELMPFAVAGAFDLLQVAEDGGSPLAARQVPHNTCICQKFLGFVDIMAILLFATLSILLFLACFDCSQATSFLSIVGHRCHARGYNL